MDFTITCPNCGTKLTLFESQTKKKQGSIRCVHCGNRVRYDTTKPGGGTGYWPTTETPFKPGAKNKFLSIAKAQQKNPDFQFKQLTAPPEDLSVPSRIPQAFDRSQNAFQKFDMKTGRIVTDAPAAEISPKTAAKKITLPPPLSAPAEKERTARNAPHLPEKASAVRAAPAERRTPKLSETLSAEASRPARTETRAAKSPVTHAMLRSASAPAPQAAAPKAGLLSRIRSFFSRFMKS